MDHGAEDERGEMHEHAHDTSKPQGVYSPLDWVLEDRKKEPKLGLIPVGHYCGKTGAEATWE